MNKTRALSFAWQHIMLALSLYVMTLGVSLCVRSGAGSSVISVLPYVFETAGKSCLYGIPDLSIGEYTYIMNALLVLGQILVLRKKFELIQLFQLVIGFVFGFMIDINMSLTSWLLPDSLLERALTQFVGCCVLGIGIAFEVRCGSVTMPGEGFPVAVSKVLNLPFAKVKMIVDCVLVMLGIISCYFIFGAWQWQIIGAGTLFAMFFVGIVVRFLSGHIGWFDKVLAYVPGFRRYIYGLASYLYGK